MNIRKVVARLNAASPKFEGGRGGMPEFTPQDVAASIGMVEDVIGREVFCVAWWPDGAKLMRKDLQQGICNLLFDDFSARYKALSAARLELHLIDGSGTPAAKRLVAKARADVEAAEKRAWPRSIDKFDLIADAVLLEICAPKQCKTCGGRSLIFRDSLQVTCPTCHGVGVRGSSGAWRAARLNMSESAYRKYWSQVYEWIYEIVARRESGAAKRICEALGYGMEEAA